MSMIMINTYQKEISVTQRTAWVNQSIFLGANSLVSYTLSCKFIQHKACWHIIRTVKEKIAWSRKHTNLVTWKCDVKDTEYGNSSLAMCHFFRTRTSLVFSSNGIIPKFWKNTPLVYLFLFLSSLFSKLYIDRLQ